MPRRKVQPQKNHTGFLNLNLSESYISLFLGALVVVFATVLLITFSKNKIYDKINTSVSTFEAPKTSQNIENPKTYVVQSGETLWSIAERVYGSGYNWVNIASANKLEDSNLIETGTRLTIPDVQKITVQTNQQIDNNSPSISGNSYKIVEGDYLWDIAIRRYGDGYKWPEIARVNNIPNPDLIYTGDTLKLP